MPIKWSARQVSESLGELERLLDEAEPILQRLLDKASETGKVPNLPEYIGQPLGWFCQKTGDFYSGQKDRIERMREYIPKEALAKEQAEFEKLLAFFNGDRQKAEMTMNLSKPKANEAPKEQIKMSLGDTEVVESLDLPQLIDEPLSERTCQDYIYCEDCQMFVDFWKYDHNIGDAGHDGHNWRYVTEEELEDCIADCEAEGCFEENML